MGRQEGLQLGEAKGRQEEQRKIAAKLLAEGIPPQRVAELVDLPLDEIRKLTH